MAKVIYQLTTKDVQDAVMSLLDRKLTKEEMEEMKDSLHTCMAHYRGIYRALKEINLLS